MFSFIWEIKHVICFEKAKSFRGGLAFVTDRKWTSNLFFFNLRLWISDANLILTSARSPNGSQEPSDTGFLYCHTTVLVSGVGGKKWPPTLNNGNMENTTCLKFMFMHHYCWVVGELLHWWHTGPRAEVMLIWSITPDRFESGSEIRLHNINVSRTCNSVSHFLRVHSDIQRIVLHFVARWKSCGAPQSPSRKLCMLN